MNDELRAIIAPYLDQATNVHLDCLRGRRDTEDVILPEDLPDILRAAQSINHNEETSP